MPMPYPRELRDEVVAVARKGEASMTQIAKNLKISGVCVRNWLMKADIEGANVRVSASFM